MLLQWLHWWVLVLLPLIHLHLGERQLARLVLLLLVLLLQ
jgi:hypothetical protein